MVGARGGQGRFGQLQAMPCPTPAALKWGDDARASCFRAMADGGLAFRETTLSDVARSQSAPFVEGTASDPGCAIGHVPQALTMFWIPALVC
jgi:hypothetical protein